MMDAIVAAGGTPVPGDLLYEYTQGKPKALLDIAGKPMIQWVLDALDQAATINQVIIVGLSPEDGVKSAKTVAYVADQGELLENLRAGVFEELKLDPQAHHVLSVSSDIPGITAEMVDWVVEKAMETDDDGYYTVVPREVMEARYPNSRRSYTRLKDIEACGGDMHVLRTKTVTHHNDLWDRIVAARKNAFKQASLLGYDTLILVMLRLITVEQGVKMVSRRLKIKARVLVSPYAELGMDVDKPHQLELMRTDLARRVPA